MMMQENVADNENHRSLNYTKIDRCQDNLSIDNDESCRQISSSNADAYSKEAIQIKLNFTHRLRLIFLVFLFFTSHSNALPIPRSQSPPPSYPLAMVQLTERLPYPQQSFNVYRRFPNPIQQPVHLIPSYSNGGAVQVYNPQSSVIAQNQQFKRERQRRAMVEKIITIFDEDGSFISVFSFEIPSLLSRQWTINKR